VSAKQRFGSPPDEILEEASDWGADLILIGHHNGLGRWFLGSVADSLLKRSVVPVLVVPQLGPVREPAMEPVAGGEAPVIT
jgi:nucleotide-binding universal stress UspA family protein